MHPSLAQCEVYTQKLRLSIVTKHRTCTAHHQSRCALGATASTLSYSYNCYSYNHYNYTQSALQHVKWQRKQRSSETCYAACTELCGQARTLWITIAVDVCHDSASLVIAGHHAYVHAHASQNVGR
eukprot:4816-Heterococcus_DN1.PRE.7